MSAEKLLADIDSIEKDCMVPDWDGYNAEAISKDTITLARQIAENLTGDWDVSPMPDGTIGFDRGHIETGVESITVIVLKRGTWLKE